MASRTFSLPEGALENRVVSLYCAVTIGSSGAVASYSGKGIASVVKESAAGQYTVTLQDQYNALLHPSMTLLDDTDSSPATVGTHMRLQSQAVSASTPTVVVQCYAGDDGADANPADGAVIYLKLELRNSTV